MLTVYQKKQKIKVKFLPKKGYKLYLLLLLTFHGASSLISFSFSLSLLSRFNSPLSTYFPYFYLFFSFSLVYHFLNCLECGILTNHIICIILYVCGILTNHIYIYTYIYTYIYKKLVFLSKTSTKLLLLLVCNTKLI